MNHISKIGQIAIPVHQLDKAVAFYHLTLGLPLLFQTDHMAFLECQGIRLLLSIPEKKEFDHPSSIIYFQVDDMTAAYEELTAKNVAFMDEPHLIAKMGNTETWMAFFKDPDGNTHALMSEVAV